MYDGYQRTLSAFPFQSAFFFIVKQRETSTFSSLPFLLAIYLVLLLHLHDFCALFFALLSSSSFPLSFSSLRLLGWACPPIRFNSSSLSLPLSSSFSFFSSTLSRGLKTSRDKKRLLLTSPFTEAAEKEERRLFLVLLPQVEPPSLSSSSSSPRNAFLVNFLLFFFSSFSLLSLLLPSFFLYRETETSITTEKDRG